MKKIIGIAMMTLFLGFSSFAHAQEKVEKEVKHAGHEVGKGAKKVGHKTASVASKGKSKIVDKTYKDKEGPNGQVIYIDRHSKYYWVDDKGHKNYVEESELRDKQK